MAVLVDGDGGRTGGEQVELRCAPGWLAPVLQPVLPATGDGAAVAGSGTDAVTGRRGTRAASLLVEVSAERGAFRLPGARTVTRGVLADGRRVLLHDACSSGFDLLIELAGDVADPTLRVQARYRPELRTRAANTVLRGRFRLLARQVLLHYPVLWRAGLRGYVPLHASAFVPAGSGSLGGTGRPVAGPAEAGGPGTAVLLIGPGGIGKSTLLSAELAAGATACSDNLCVWGGGLAHGLVEPQRLEGGSGPRSTHGRREQALPQRVDAVRPDRLVLLRRAGSPGARPLPVEHAARALTGGTYAAGELRRYWAFCAALSLGTGRGPAHPPIQAVATELAAALPAVEVCLGDDRRRRLDAVLEEFAGLEGVA
jgi:hypothetical protein